MITKLSKEQEARFPEYVAKWTAIGLSTEPIDRTAVKKTLSLLYATANKPSAKPVWCHSPLEAVLIISILRDTNVSDNVRDNVRDNVLANVRDNVLANVLANVRDNVLANVLANVSANVRANVLANVLANVSDNVLANVSDNVRDNVLANVSDLLSWYYYDFGQFAAYWLSYYDFCAEQFGVDTSALSPNDNFCRQAGWSFLFWKWAFISERPTGIHRNSRGQLHKDGEAAILYSDGWGVYTLNGIRMKPEYVLTPPEQLSPETVLAETNADIRRELIRKVGIERMKAKLPHKILDSRGNYKLLSINLGDGATDARYLEMVNPSIGCFHMEGVSPECDTIEKSLNFRNQNRFTDAEILT